jgi:hypothetical protein
MCTWHVCAGDWAWHGMAWPWYEAFWALVLDWKALLCRGKQVGRRERTTDCIGAGRRDE